MAFGNGLQHAIYVVLYSGFKFHCRDDETCAALCEENERK